jgi:ketosteroid isomerase-like protein
MKNIETVQAIYAAFGAGDVPAILERLAEDVEWEHDSVDHGIRWLKPRRGRNDVVNFFASLGDLQFHRFEIRNLLTGGDQVAAVLHVEHTDRATGKRFTDLELHLWTFGADGRVTRFRHVVDTHQLLLQGQRDEASRG